MLQHALVDYDWSRDDCDDETNAENLLAVFTTVPQRNGVSFRDESIRTKLEECRIRLVVYDLSENEVDNSGVGHRLSNGSAARGSINGRRHSANNGFLGGLGSVVNLMPCQGGGWHFPEVDGDDGAGCEDERIGDESYIDEALLADIYAKAADDGSWDEDVEHETHAEVVSLSSERPGCASSVQVKLVSSEKERCVPCSQSVRSMTHPVNAGTTQELSFTITRKSRHKLKK